MKQKLTCNLFLPFFMTLNSALSSLAAASSTTGFFLGRPLFWGVGLVNIDDVPPELEAESMVLVAPCFPAGITGAFKKNQISVNICFMLGLNNWTKSTNLLHKS